MSDEQKITMRCLTKMKVQFLAQSEPRMPEQVMQVETVVSKKPDKIVLKNTAIVSMPRF